MTRKTKSKSRRTFQSRSAPAAAGTRSRNRHPNMRTIGDTLQVAHTEYVGDVMTDTTNDFAYDVFSLDPSNATTFPWLSTIAQRYESFRFDQLFVEFRSAVGTTVTGKVIIAIDYDCKDDDSAVTKTQMLNWESTVDCNSWDNIRHSSTKANLQRVGPWRFMNPAVSDERLSSAGKLYVATTQSSLATVNGSSFFQANLGELFITYVVSLKTPQLAPYIGAASQMAQTRNVPTTGGATTNMLSQAKLATVIDDEVAPYGIEIRRGDDGNRYLQQGTSATYASVTEDLLLFTQDFVGLLIAQTMSVVNNNTTAPSITQYAALQANVLGDAPDLASNYTQVLQAIAGGVGVIGNNLAAYFVDVAAGTAFRMNGPQFVAGGAHDLFLYAAPFVGLAPATAAAIARGGTPKLAKVGGRWKRNEKFIETSK